MGVFSKLSGAPKQPDGVTTGEGRRTGKYGEQYVFPIMGSTKHGLADEGAYFVATNPTPGTALASAVNASSDFTKALFLFRNTDSVGGKRCYIDYVKVLPTVAPASATSMQVAVQIDNSNRYSSAGTDIGNGVNVNSEDGTVSVGKLYASSGAAVIVATAASSAARLVHRSTPRSVIPAALEEIVIQFGDNTASAGSSSGTAAGRTSTNGAPLIVAPGYSAVFNVWFPSNAATGLSYEFEFAWFER